jgi:hypothetical protein
LRQARQCSFARTGFEMNPPVRWKFALHMRLNFDSRPRN